MHTDRCLIICLLVKKITQMGSFAACLWKSVQSVASLRMRS